MAEAPSSRRFQVASEDEIRAGRITDIYFKHAVRVLTAAGLDRAVTAEVRARRLPEGLTRGVFCGLNEVVGLLEGIPGLEVEALAEGTFFGPEEPVLVLRGMYTTFAVHETALLGLICQASGIASAALRCRETVGDKLLLSFGARRQHPALAPMIERAAYIGGADGVSSVLGAELLGLRPRGTMPHAMILVVGDTVAAARLFDETLEADVPRVVLVDTFLDETTESVRVAHALGERLRSVRLDTPASRRGDFRSLIQEVRWELDLHGFKAVQIIVSGGLGVQDLEELRDVADGFGVGSTISEARHIDFALDIVEVQGEPRAKRGKRSGRKQLWSCPRTKERKLLPVGVEWDRPAGFPPPEPLLQPILREGRPVAPQPNAETIRGWVLEQRQAERRGG